MGILVFDGDQGRKRNHDGDLVDVKKRQHIVCSGDNLRGMKNENMGGQIQCLVLFRGCASEDAHLLGARDNLRCKKTENLGGQIQFLARLCI